MTAAPAKERKPVRSGFCNRSNPPASHAHCRLEGCPCTCHEPPKPKTTCHEGCGACCDPVTITPDAADRLFRGDLYAEGTEARYQQEFVRAMWTEVGRKPWGQVRAGHSLDGDDEAVLVECAMFDRDTRSCTAYDARPQICEGYPWYGDEPGERTSGPAEPTCAFHADVPGRRVLPLIVL